MRDAYVHLQTETVFESGGLLKNGESPLSFLKCIEHKDADNWTLDVQVLTDYSDVIVKDYIIYLNTVYGYQPFRIGNITRSKVISFQCKHIGYDLLNFVIENSTSVELNCQDAMQFLLDHLVPSGSFTVYSDIQSIKTISIAGLSGYNAFVALAEAYGGFLDFDGFQIRITEGIGGDRGVNIEYGMNLIDAEVTENWDKVVTELMPTGTGGITIPGGWLFSEIDYGIPYRKIIPFETDNVDDLQFVASLYLAKYQYPMINYRVKAHLTDNDVFIGDTILAIAPNFTIMMKVFAYDSDRITETVSSTEFGNYRTNPKSFIDNLKGEIEAHTIQKARLMIDETNGILKAMAAQVDIIGVDLEHITAEQTAINVKVDGVTTTITYQAENIENLQGQIDENGNAITAVDNRLTTHQTFFKQSASGLEIGRSDSPAQVLIGFDENDDSQVVITDGNSPTTIIKSNSTQTPNLVVTESARVGNHKIQKLTGSVTETVFLPI